MTGERAKRLDYNTFIRKKFVRRLDIGKKATKVNSASIVKINIPLFNFTQRVNIDDHKYNISMRQLDIWYEPLSEEITL